MAPPLPLICPFCGQEHRLTQLQPGEKALCVRCDSLMARGTRLGADAALVFSLTGLVLALPAMILPFVSANNLGAERISRLFTGAGSLLDGGMIALAILVFLCGGLLPLTLLAILTILHAPARFRRPNAELRTLRRVARLLEHWAIPEVQILAVLVALLKLGHVVNITIGPGFWCYCGMALSLLIAQRSSDYESPQSVGSAGQPAPASSP